MIPRALQDARPEQLRRTCPSTWQDEHGRWWSTPTAPARLKWRHPLHFRLRAFVFRRDGFRCQECGRGPSRPPLTRYTGRRCVVITYAPLRVLLVDHIVSLKNGGSNHPINLRACCDRCNTQKVGLVDAKVLERTRARAA